jgi:hypothetical protein
LLQHTVSPIAAVDRFDMKGVHVDATHYEVEVIG